MDLSSIVIPKWVKYAAGAALMAALLTLTYCTAENAGERKVKAEQLEADIKTLNTENTANEAAADERVKDSQELNKQAEELHDASTNPGDDSNTRRLRRLCVQLRQQGGNPDDIAACRGLESGAGAQASPSGVPS